MKRKKGLIIIGAAALILLVIVVSVLKSSEPPKVIKEAKFEARDICSTFQVAAYVCARNKLQIKPSVGGRIEEILVNEGDSVKKGQVVFWMSSNERAAMMDAARAIGDDELRRWQEIYKPTPVVSPMDGFIIYREKEPGQTVNLADGILIMADDLIVYACIDETDYRHIKIGGSVKMFLEAYPDQYFEGIIEHISYDSQIQNNVVIYGVKIRPVTKPAVFRSGMTVTTVITAQSKDSVMSVPAAFIIDRGAEKTVMVKSGNSKKFVFKPREVRTGISDGKNTEILSGLNAGETVVIMQSKKQDKKSLLDLIE